MSGQEKERFNGFSGPLQLCCSHLKKVLNLSLPSPSVVHPMDHTMANRNMPSTICILTSSEKVAPERQGKGGI